MCTSDVCDDEKGVDDTPECEVEKTDLHTSGVGGGDDDDDCDEDDEEGVDDDNNSQDKGIDGTNEDKGIDDTDEMGVDNDKDPKFGEKGAEDMSDIGLGDADPKTRETCDGSGELID